ncbi:MAG: hypothetical protein RLZZ387_686, partial [Chloroflexota bacterium]
EDSQYRYGFEVTSQRIMREWLYRLGNAREALLFQREQDEIKVRPQNFREGRGLQKFTRPNALFLSVAAQFNGEIASRILAWFRTVNVNTGVTDQGDMLNAFAHYVEGPHREAIERLIQRLDVGIDGLHLERTPASIPTDAPEPIAEGLRAFFAAIRGAGEEPENITIKTLHNQYDGEESHVGTITFDLEQHESAGTQRLFVLAHPILHALQEGTLIVIDEFDARIHSNLAVELIELFNDPETNPRHAQLIFTTHNTNLLSANLFRRDQVWFVEKSRQGASDLYSLLEYRNDGKIIRNDASFEKDYILGRYGAIPYIGDLQRLLGALNEQTATTN